jgi:hypothetical protein
MRLIQKGDVAEVQARLDLASTNIKAMLAHLKVTVCMDEAEYKYQISMLDHAREVLQEIYLDVIAARYREAAPGASRMPPEQYQGSVHAMDALEEALIAAEAKLKKEHAACDEKQTPAEHAAAPDSSTLVLSHHVLSGDIGAHAPKLAQPNRGADADQPVPVAAKAP